MAFNLSCCHVVIVKVGVAEEQEEWGLLAPPEYRFSNTYHLPLYQLPFCQGYIALKLLRKGSHGVPRPCPHNIYNIRRASGYHQYPGSS